jgi:hypothetical protein
MLLADNSPLAHPALAEELARTAAVTALQYAFRLYYPTTPFGYLRRVRRERVRANPVVRAISLLPLC